MFAFKNNICLTDTEKRIIYDHIKQDADALLYGNAKDVFLHLEQTLTPTNYNKLSSLYKEYKDKYGYFL